RCLGFILSESWGTCVIGVGVWKSCDVRRNASIGVEARSEFRRVSLSGEQGGTDGREPRYPRLSAESRGMTRIGWPPSSKVEKVAFRTFERGRHACPTADAIAAGLRSLVLARLSLIPV